MTVRTQREKKAGAELEEANFARAGRHPRSGSGHKSSGVIRDRARPTPGEHFLAHIEFDRPELPWLFSTSDVLRGGQRSGRSLAGSRRARSGLHPVRGFAAGAAPAASGPAKASSTAHHSIVGFCPRASGDASAAPKISDRLSARYGPVDTSRIFCPCDRGRPGEHRLRRPSCRPTSCGVQIGLGLPGGSLARAWERTAARDPPALLRSVEFHRRPPWRLRKSRLEYPADPSRMADGTTHHRCPSPARQRRTKNWRPKMRPCAGAEVRSFPPNSRPPARLRMRSGRSQNAANCATR